MDLFIQITQVRDQINKVRHHLILRDDLVLRILCKGQARHHTPKEDQDHLVHHILCKDQVLRLIYKEDLGHLAHHKEDQDHLVRLVHHILCKGPVRLVHTAHPAYHTLKHDQDHHKEDQDRQDRLDRLDHILCRDLVLLDHHTLTQDQDYLDSLFIDLQDLCQIIHSLIHQAFKVLLIQELLFSMDLLLHQVLDQVLLCHILQRCRDRHQE